jgi:hypothetical protein
MPSVHAGTVRVPTTILLGDNTVKITKRQLRRIIKEERLKLIKEAPHDRVAIEGKLLGELMGLLADLKAVEKELYGLVEPGRGGSEMGSVYAEELDATIEELGDWKEKLTRHFESNDTPTSGTTPTEGESGIPDSKRSVIHNRRPDW